VVRYIVVGKVFLATMSMMGVLWVAEQSRFVGGHGIRTHKLD
jgi:hypothetical protein